MEKRRSGQTIAIVALSIAVLVMSVGFALYNTDLNINGTANVGASKWDVHFKTTSYAETSGSAVASTKNVSETTFSYTITLDKPGDYYEATVDVENTGDFDADLVKVTMSSLTEAQSKYLTYKLYYGSTEYTSTTDVSGITLAKKTGTEKVKIRVDYIVPENEADLPTTGASNISLTAMLSYKQAA